MEAWAADLASMPPAVHQALKLLEEGGGGFQNAGPKAGLYSANGATIKYQLRCCSSYHWGCIYRPQVVCNLLAEEYEVWVPDNWKHVHSGNLKSTRGLPPQVSSAVDEIVKAHPYIKPTALKNLLFNQYGFDRAKYDKQVRWYIGNHASARRDMSLGVSAYGTCSTILEKDLQRDVVLAHPDATIDSVYCIGNFLQPESNDLQVEFSSIKGLLAGFNSMHSGYNKGLLLKDDTFKIFKEKLYMKVSSTVDIAQHGHIISFGPATSCDSIVEQRSCTYIMHATEDLLTMIKDRKFPDSWSVTLVSDILKQYSFTVDAHPPVLRFGTILADLAPAIGNGAMASGIIVPAIRTGISLADMDQEVQVEMIKGCNSHLWRAAVKKMNELLRDKSQENKDVHYTAISTLNAITCAKYKAVMKHLYEQQYHKAEPEFVEYTVKHLLKHNFMRCDGNVGDPTDTNTRERQNLDMKSENYYNSVEGLGTVLKRTPIVGKLMFENQRSFAYAPDIPLKDWKKAQSLLEKGWMYLGYKNKDAFVFPSEDLINDHIPANKSVDEAKAYIKTWYKEFKAWAAKPDSYCKVVNGEWDFEVAADMLLSFWTLKPIPDSHPRKLELKEKGIVYTCTCPRYHHYHFCKHSLALGLKTGEVKVPLRFSKVTAGKRKAPAGASLRKRTKALEVDN